MLTVIFELFVTPVFLQSESSRNCSSFSIKLHSTALPDFAMCQQFGLYVMSKRLNCKIHQLLVSIASLHTDCSSVMSTPVKFQLQCTLHLFLVLYVLQTVKLISFPSLPSLLFLLPPVFALDALCRVRSLSCLKDWRRHAPIFV